MNNTSTATQFAFASPHEALDRLLSRLVPVEQERIDLNQSAGRVLSKPIHADRDSPPSDVSAMDGYAVRVSHVEQAGVLQIAGEIAIGEPAPPMPEDACLKIGTGACVPSGCDGVIPREQVDEAIKAITITPGLAFRAGQHIRSQGENMPSGALVIPTGTTITPPVACALAAFGHATIPAYKPVRVAILTTGDELQAVGASPRPWQIRDSNTTTLHAALSPLPRAKIVETKQVKDDPTSLAEALQAAARSADLVITTGGVSMGDHDYLKPALLAAGGEVVYHKLPIRPGKPSLAGLLPMHHEASRVVPVIALPGNPVAVAVGVPLFIGPAVRMLAGISDPSLNRPLVGLRNPPSRKLGLWRYLTARWVGHGEVEMLTTKGSGDLAAAALADGFVQIPPNGEGPGPWVFYDATP